MKLKRIERLPSTKLSGSIPGDVSDALNSYTEYYRTMHGDPIRPWSLVVQILRTFFDDDRAFQTWRRRNGGGTAEAQAGSANGAAAESRDGSR